MAHAQKYRTDGRRGMYANEQTRQETNKDGSRGVPGTGGWRHVSEACGRQDKQEKKEIDNRVNDSIEQLPAKHQR